MAQKAPDLWSKHFMHLKHDSPEEEGKYSVEVESMGFGVSLYMGLKPILPQSGWMAHVEAELAYLLVLESNLHHKNNTVKVW